MPGVQIPAGGKIDLSVKGSIGVTAGTEGVFREAFTLQLTAQGFRVLAIEIDTDFGLVSRDYVATVTLSPLASMSDSAVVAAVRRAAEIAGSWTPVVTATSSGEAAQKPIPANVVQATAQSAVDAVSGILKGVGGLGEGVGKAADNVADLTKDLKTVLIVAAVGLVIIVGFIAFGPNVGKVARAAR